MAKRKIWGVEVKSGEPFLAKPGNNTLIHLTQASLGDVGKDKGSKSIDVFVKLDDQKVVVGRLSTEKSRHISLDLVFDKDFELSHNWKNGSVHFCGYKSYSQRHYPFYFNIFNYQVVCLLFSKLSCGLCSCLTFFCYVITSKDVSDLEAYTSDEEHMVAAANIDESDRDGEDQAEDVDDACGVGERFLLSKHPHIEMAGSSSEGSDPDNIGKLVLIYGIDFSYTISLVDRNKQKFSVNLQEYPIGMGFAGYGPILYMIGGCSPEEHPKDGEFYSRDVFTLDIHRLAPNCDLGKLISEGPRLNSRKVDPIAFVVRGFIYVLSAEFLMLDYGSSNFEVLDPSLNKWVSLPEPTIDRSQFPWNLPFEIDAHVVKEDRYIVISAPYFGGVYEFDVANHSAGWAHVAPFPLQFVDEAISLSHGGQCYYYAFLLGRFDDVDDPHHPDIFYAFPDAMGPPLIELKIEPPSPEVAGCYLHRLLICVGRTCFVVRHGLRTLPEDGTVSVAVDEIVTVDSFEVTEDHEVVNPNSYSFVVAKDVDFVRLTSLHCIHFSNTE